MSGVKFINVLNTAIYDVNSSGNDILPYLNNSSC